MTERKYSAGVCLMFVNHIQAHLEKKERGNKAYLIPEMEVGCTICGKSITQISMEILKKRG